MELIYLLIKKEEKMKLETLDLIILSRVMFLLMEWTTLKNNLLNQETNYLETILSQLVLKEPLIKTLISLGTRDLRI